MANNMTGDFDAVVQVAVRQINGVLATLHQNGVNDDAPLKLLHNATLRIGDSTHRPPDVGAFGDWVAEYQMAGAPVDAGDLRTQLTGMAPPGAASVFKNVFDKLGTIVIPPEVVHGKAKLQLSSATLSLPNGSTSEVTVHTDVRATYEPDPSTDDLPAPIHGEVQAVFVVHVAQTATGRKLLITPTPSDNKIQFIAAAGSGLSAGDADRISVQVRKALRQGFTLVPVDLPADFPFPGFKAVGTGAGQAVALPLQLSGGSGPAGGLQNIVTPIVGAAGFAFGIGREFVKSVFQPTIDQLLQFQQNFTISIPFWPDPTYHFSVTGVDLQFNDKNIDLIVHGKATTGAWGFSNYNDIVIKQRFALLLVFDTLFIQVSDYEPEVTGVSSRAVDAVKAAVKAQRDQALPPAQKSLNDQLKAAMARLNRAMHSFSPAASAALRAGFSEDAASATTGGIAITPDGVIIRGDISMGAVPMAPIVEIAAIEPGKTYSAFTSWIPGGRIDRFVWSWIEGSPIVAWGGDVKTMTDEHRFILSIPPPKAGPGPLGQRVVTQVCLRLEGSRILADGSAQPIAGGTICHVPEPEVLMDVPSWWEPVHVPVWLPGLADSAIAKDAIAAHVTVQRDTPATKGDLTRNSLVYFADWRAPDPLAAIAGALGRLQRKSVALAVTVVVPPGAFGVSRKEIDGKLASITAKFPFPVHVTEDDEGGWTKTFAVSKVPSTFLINARRQFVWSDNGHADAAALAAALDRYLTPAPIPHARPLRLAVAPGDRAPDALFQTGRDEQVAIHRMRGRRMLLNFWQNWSAPCLQELRRLQTLQAAGARDAPVIVAFHGGRDAKSVEEIRKQLGITFAFVQDSEQQIARAYGVRCWPTTVSIDADGRIEHVQCGVMTEHEAGRGRAGAAAG